MTSKHPASAAPQNTDRYEVHELLGRGGMASVYRATDRQTRRVVALKQLLPAAISGEQSRVFTLFEREFHTLAQLQHPHVIGVYDYGMMPDGSPFYTMELLDGGDLRERTPLPWKQACGLLFEVCSSLGLLHSRRLLHRDVTPRNIRCTSDGRAKLIDFGAMAHMSTGGADVVGTPAFVAPETVHRLTLDARTDLYSLGVTLYFTLTGNLPYPALSFADVLAAWGGKVQPPSSWVRDIPAALDDLVLSLISVEPALRPHSASEVMQRLAAIAGLSARESEAVGAAYLNTPSLVGRDAALERFRSQLVSARLSRGGSLAIEGEAGMGRSRFLNACVLEAKTLGFTVVRATASGTREQLAVASDLTEHLIEALPDLPAARVAPELFTSGEPAAESGEPTALRLRKASELSATPAQLQKAILRLWASVSRDKPLLIAIDDVHRIDQESAAVLADLLERSTRGRVFVLLSVDPGEESLTAATLLRRTQVHKLEPFTREQMRSLLESLFGDVPNLDMLAGELHEITAGNPGRGVDLAQQLVDRGLVRYEAGSWTLPRRLSADDLPRNAADALARRIAQLSVQARFLGQMQALAFDSRFRDREYRTLSDGKRELAERAVAELLTCGAVRSDGPEYFLASKLWSAALIASLDPGELVERHKQLAELYRPTSQVAFIYHAFAGEMDEEGLAALQDLNDGVSKGTYQSVLEQNVAKMMQAYPRAFESAQRLGKSARFINELRRWNLAGNVSLDDASYPESAPLWRAQLEKDSGLDLYRADPDVSDPMQRLLRALTGAQQRYAATPEAERVYSVEEALKMLAEYVVVCIGIGSRVQQAALVASLPELLEPFSVLSPILDAIWNNARATCEGTVRGNLHAARVLWNDVLKKLDAMDGNELPYVPAIANAVAFAIGTMEAQLALPSASKLAERLDRDPYHKVSALQLRRILRLEHGDFAGAERLRRQGEIVALQARIAPMFKSLLSIELGVCAMARDLAGVQQVLEQIRPLAEHHPGWVPTLLCAEACFHLVRGDLEEAERKCRQCVTAGGPDASGVPVNMLMHLMGSALLSEVLLAMGRAEEALAVARDTLAQRAADGCDEPVELVIAYALAAASLGRPDAVPKLEAVIAAYTGLGAGGLRLGVAYEARARIAIWQRDAAAFERYAELTAREYRHGADSPLGARYERLRNEAVRHGLHATASLSDFAAPGEAYNTVLGTDLQSTVVRELSGLERVEQRAASALQLLCAAHNAQSGQLYLAHGTELFLTASRGELPEQPEPSTLQAHVARWLLRSAAMEEMETGEMEEDELLSDPSSEDAMLTLSACRYQLLVLATRSADGPQIAGVALVEHTDAPIDGAREAQLLSLLAEQLAPT